MIYYQYACWRLGAGDGFQWATANAATQTHPFRLLIAHVEGEGDKRKATAQLEVQFSREQLEALAVQVQTLLKGETQDDA